MKQQNGIFTITNQLAGFRLQDNTSLTSSVDYYTLVFCLQGSYTYADGHIVHHITPGSLHLFTPRMPKVYESVSGNIQAYTISFTKDFLDDTEIKDAVLEKLLDTPGDQPAIFRLKPQKIAVVKEIVRSMMTEYNETDDYAKPIIRLQLIRLLYEAHRSAEHAHNILQPVSRGQQLVQAYLREVDQHFRELRTVQEYADLLHVSAKHLSAVVKMETGETALHILHRRIYREAHYLLHYSSLSIKEIAEELNFDTSSHFSRFFKQYTGYNPTDLKKEYKHIQEHRLTTPSFLAFTEEDALV
jgi:AraC-like DNA-binding protein